MASLLVILVILGCAVYQYLKGTLVKSFAAVITAVCASIVAFGYFELLANVFINRELIVSWAQPLCFVLLFVLAFAILQTIAVQLVRRPIDLGLAVERIGSVVCGIFLGLILSGLLLTALALAPLSNKYPYQRFASAKPDAEKPNKVLFNTDGFVTGWFSTISSGSFSGKRSFAALHPDFLGQIFLNRHNIADDVPIITGSEAIQVAKKKAAWPAPEGLKDLSGKPVSPKSGHNLIIVRVGITAQAIKNGGAFTFSQLRLVCKQKGDTEKPFAGSGKNVYPVGYLKAANQLRITKLSDQIKLERLDFADGIREIDFAFYVPNDFVPVLVEFKQNGLAEVPSLVPADQAPPAVPFIQPSKCAKDIAELQPIDSQVYGIELAAGNKFLAGLTLKISNPNHWQRSETPRSSKPAQFDEDGKVNYVKSEMKIAKPAKAARTKKTRVRRGQKTEEIKSVSEMLKPLNGYKLLSLKCNNPPTGEAIYSEQLPVLVELAGLIHHPVGIIASGKIGEQTVYEVEYCSLTTEDIADGLIIAEDGSVTEPFIDTVWLAEQADSNSISEFYVIYLVKSGKNTIVMSVQSADLQESARFKKHEGFFIK